MFFYIPSEHLFDRFMPRSVCMFHDTKLIALHAMADGIICLSYLVLAIALFSIYGVVTERFLPFKGFIWMFGAFIFLCGITHLIGVINLFVTFYWLDGAIKGLTAIVSIIVAIKFLPATNELRGMRTEQEFKEIEDRLHELEKRVTSNNTGTI